ncbi:MAG TPA: hypothetical protein VGM18_15250 [Candidatus Sulfotelmatobacter sp.]|jgi:hypothetical protein
MATNATRSQQETVNAVVHAALAKDGALAKEMIPRAEGSAPRRASGYGLPCSKCHLYYPADLDACPTCHHNERVSPVVAKIPVRAVSSEADPIPDTAVIEQEREEFLRQFKSQLLEAHADVVKGPEAFCKIGEHHSGEPASAEICNACYERLQERVDVFEAALHLELKEAAQIIYDAVWADPSDPNKTYQNAASALLTELRKRAGMTAVLGPFQPLAH